MFGNVLSLIGLFIDIVGAVILFKFGLPSEVNKNGGVPYVADEPDPEQVEKLKRYPRFAKFGIVLLIAGFFFQFLGTCISANFL